MLADYLLAASPTHPPMVNLTVPFLGTASLSGKRLRYYCTQYPEYLGTENLFKPQ